MDELNRLQGIAHEYRKSVDAYERRTGRAGQTVDNLGSGEEREKFAKMDADLDAVERTIQSQYAMRKAAEDRVRELEARLAEPTLRAKAVESKQALDPNSSEFAARWLMAHATKNEAEIRELSVGSTTNAAVPTDMERRIVERMHQSSVLRQLAKRSVIDSSRTIRIESTLPTAALVAEGGTITPADPAYDTVSVTPYKYVAATTMTKEFIEDSIGTSGIGTALQYVTDRLGVALAKKMDEAFTIGSGSSQPQGIGDVTSTSWATTNSGRIINQGVQLAEDAVATAITGDNIIDCIHAVGPQYRNSPRFQILTSDTVLKTVRKIKTTASGGDYVWKLSETGGLSQGYPGTIYGIPYQIGEYIATTQVGATGANARGNAYFIVGHWDYFEIFDRAGIESMIDPYTAAATQKSTMYVWARTDSKIMLPEAFAAIYGDNDGV
jgi:HK97 family phage major capsid protein